MLKLGIIGLSEGNGHPYSWAAICNGYNKEAMSNCPFPVIPEYLSTKIYPDDFLSDLCQVTHIWTQDMEMSAAIAKASNIPVVINNISDMIGHVDAVLLARDDSENHAIFSKPILMEGLPIYIDKPLATNLNDAIKLFEQQLYPSQIFTCSALRYAQELMPSDIEMAELGQIQFIQATIPNSWEKYAVHIIEPVISSFPNRGLIKNYCRIRRNDIVNLSVEWSNICATFTTFGKRPVPLEIRYFFDDGLLIKFVNDTFDAFRGALVAFINQITEHRLVIPREETIEVVNLIEKGTNA